MLYHWPTLPINTNQMNPNVCPQNFLDPWNLPNQEDLVRRKFCPLPNPTWFFRCEKKTWCKQNRINQVIFSTEKNPWFFWEYSRRCWKDGESWNRLESVYFGIPQTLATEPVSNLVRNQKKTHNFASAKNMGRFFGYMPIKSKKKQPVHLFFPTVTHQSLSFGPTEVLHPRDLGADGTALGGIQGFKEPRRLDSMDRHTVDVRSVWFSAFFVKRPCLCLMFDVVLLVMTNPYSFNLVVCKTYSILLGVKLL